MATSIKTHLIIFSNYYPNLPSHAESWLADELGYTFSNYNSIVIYPSLLSKQYRKLPDNSTIGNYGNQKKLIFTEVIFCFKIALSEFSRYPNKIDFFKNFKYSFSLLMQLYKRANVVAQNINNLEGKIILYPYWADNLATLACFVKHLNPHCKIVTRAHGFEIYEEQTLYNVVPFREFHYKYIDKMYADSNKGFKHLNQKHPKYASKNELSYVGTLDYGYNPFEPNNNFTIVSCATLTDNKRVHLLTEVLKNITFSLNWIIIGDGERMETLKQNVKRLPVNISVNIKGSLAIKEVIEFYKTTPVNLFVSLSKSEGLPVSMMEAQSFGIPILSTDVGGCSEICNENTGILIPTDFNPIEVANQITQFKNSEKNSNFFHLQCRKNWEINFKAEINYKKFSEKILNI